MKKMLRIGEVSRSEEREWKRYAGLGSGQHLAMEYMAQKEKIQ